MNMVSALHPEPHKFPCLGSNNFQNIPGQIGARHKQMILSFLGLVVYGLHTATFDVGIVAMTRPSGSSTSYPTLNFTMAQKGVIMSSGSYGYTAGNILFGYLCDAYGPMMISPVAGGICSGFVYLIYPVVVLYGGYRYACSLRILNGFLLSCIYPGVYVHMSKWIAPQEQSKFSWVWTGYYFGNSIVSTAVGPITDSAGGWPAIFQFTGSLAFIWGIFALRWGSSCPADHETISNEEKMFIEKHLPLSGARKSKRTPWLDMLKSIPLWCFLLVQTFDWFATYLVYPFEATYLTGVFNISVHEAGLAVAYAHMAHIPTSFLFSYLAIKLDNRVSVICSRKIWNTIGNGGEALMFLLLAFTPQGPTSSIVLFIIAHSLSAAIQTGYMINVLDFAPNFAGTITGSLTTLSNLGVSFGGITTGLLVHDEADMESWRKVFILGGIVLFTGNLIFMTFGSAKVEHWNNLDNEQYDKEKLLD